MQGRHGTMTQRGSALIRAPTVPYEPSLTTISLKAVSTYNNPGARLACTCNTCCQTGATKLQCLG